MKRCNISSMQPFDSKTGTLNVIVETPRDCRTKFKYDEESGLFMFDKMLPIGQSFPFDFGFLPSTRGEDGDPLDALILTDHPTFPGCSVRARLLGAIEAEQTEDGETRRNDRFIAVPLEIRSGEPPAQAPTRLDSSVAKRIGQFFVAYNELQGKQFEILRVSGPDRAMELIKEGAAGARRRKASRH